MTQHALFDPATTEPAPCPVPGCAAIRLPNQTGPLPTCQHDLDRASGVQQLRPKTCANTIDPAHMPFPEGF